MFATRCFLFIIMALTAFPLYAQTLNGLWTDLDGSSIGDGLSQKGDVLCQSPRMVLDSKDQPHFIWQYGSDAIKGNGEICYLYFDKEQNKWSTYGNADGEDGLTQSQHCSNGWTSTLAVDSHCFPHVLYCAYESEKSNYQLYYRYWDGEKWTTHGGADKFPEPSILTPSRIDFAHMPVLFIDEKDYPWIVVTLDHDSVLFVFWDGEKWRGYGDSYSENGLDTSPYLTGFGGPLVKEIYDIDGYPLILCAAEGSQLNAITLPVFFDLGW
jgi:hypothetical protein